MLPNATIIDPIHTHTHTYSSKRAKRSPFEFQLSLLQVIRRYLTGNTPCAPHRLRCWPLYGFAVSNCADIFINLHNWMIFIKLLLPEINRFGNWQTLTSERCPITCCLLPVAVLPCLSGLLRMALTDYIALSLSTFLPLSVALSVCLLIIISMSSQCLLRHQLDCNICVCRLIEMHYKRAKCLVFIRKLTH